MSIKFSIIVVTLNAEKEVIKTFSSILEQTYENYEVIVKDGESKDNTLSLIPKDERFFIVEKKDKSIYDAMNQAIDFVNGNFVIFLNAGDKFYSNDILYNVKNFIENKQINESCVLYGDYCRAGEYIQRQKHKLDDFLLYRRPLCHQTMFYSSKIFNENRRYNTAYKISADHDLTLSLWKENIAFYHTDNIICEYAGGGVSESKEGLILAQKEKRKLEKKYFTKLQDICFQTLVLLSFNGIRCWIDSSHSPKFIRKIYRWVRNIYLK